MCLSLPPHGRSEWQRLGDFLPKQHEAHVDEGAQLAVVQLVKTDQKFPLPLQVGWQDMPSSRDTCNQMTHSLLGEGSSLASASPQEHESDQEAEIRLQRANDSP